MEDLKRQLDTLLRDYKNRIAFAHTEQELRKVFADFGGSSGAIRALQKRAFQAAPAGDKRELGRLCNDILKAVEEEFERRLAGLAADIQQRDLERRVDVTLPGRRRRLGHLHPITLVRRELELIFAQLGFTVVEGPQVEDDFHNFEALGLGRDHPARDMMDTFYVDGPAELLLRTHTSPVQIRTMLAHPPPVRVIAPGYVYRKDDDLTHSPMFTQVECLCVDEGVSFADLKGVLLHVIKRFFGPDFGVRLRPSFFPFTEPSAEVDMSCVFCKGQGCRRCKGSGWIEICGSGMVDPVVFQHVGYDAERYTGFAFALGVERMAMLRYGVSDIKSFYESDVRFLEQFR